ncbi:MAG: serine/threonine protein phosphatase [Sphingobacteriales bacterium]|nr:serine/threonine protein phosphatase [Sphingobacteriales bacterium]
MNISPDLVVKFNMSSVVNRYAMSDIHGCAKTFRLAVEQYIKLKPNDELYLLGDYIDRGPDSKGVFDYIWQLQASGYIVFCLKGNHEDLMLKTIANEDNWHYKWEHNGQRETLMSFGVLNPDLIPEKYINFCKSLNYYIELPDYYLVHAGFDFSQKNNFNEVLQDKESMLWIRRWYHNLKPEWIAPKKIVHGHTPITKGEIKNQLNTNIINIDNGCVYQLKVEAPILNDDSPTYGALFGLNLNNPDDSFFVECIDRTTNDDAI